MLTNASTALPAYLVHQHAALDALFANARKDFHQNLPCDNNQCRRKTDCIGDLSTTLGGIIKLATVHFTDEQRHIKPYCSAALYEDHCQEHGEITRLISDAAALFYSSRCCLGVLSSLEDIHSLVKRHRETFDAQIDIPLPRAG